MNLHSKQQLCYHTFITLSNGKLSFVGHPKPQMSLLKEISFFFIVITVTHWCKKVGWLFLLLVCVLRYLPHARFVQYSCFNEKSTDAQILIPCLSRRKAVYSTHWTVLRMHTWISYEQNHGVHFGAQNFYMRETGNGKDVTDCAPIFLQL